MSCRRGLRAAAKPLFSTALTYASLDGGRGGGGVQRAEDQLTGLRRLDGDGHRLPLPHLAHQHHIGILAQRSVGRLPETTRVRPDLTLRDDAGCSSTLMLPLGGWQAKLICAVAVTSGDTLGGAIWRTGPRICASLGGSRVSGRATSLLSSDTGRPVASGSPSDRCSCITWMKRSSRAISVSTHRTHDTDVRPIDVAGFGLG